MRAVLFFADVFKLWWYYSHYRGAGFRIKPTSLFMFCQMCAVSLQRRHNSYVLTLRNKVRPHAWVTFSPSKAIHSFVYHSVWRSMAGNLICLTRSNVSLGGRNM